MFSKNVVRVDVVRYPSTFPYISLNRKDQLDGLRARKRIILKRFLKKGFVM
jgi:hypothetical protein